MILLDSEIPRGWSILRLTKKPFRHIVWQRFGWDAPSWNAEDGIRDVLLLFTYEVDR